MPKLTESIEQSVSFVRYLQARERRTLLVVPLTEMDFLLIVDKFDHWQNVSVQTVHVCLDKGTGTGYEKKTQRTW